MEDRVIKTLGNFLKIIIVVIIVWSVEWWITAILFVLTSFVMLCEEIENAPLMEDEIE